MKQTIIRKLTSRKLWAAVVGFITPLMLAFGYSESQTSQVAAIVMAGGTLIAYIVGEGLVDSKAVDTTTTIDGVYSIPVEKDGTVQNVDAVKEDK